MSESTLTRPSTTSSSPNACCDTVLLSTCCGQEAKPACCGPEKAPTVCGCGGGHGSSREQSERRGSKD